MSTRIHTRIGRRTFIANGSLFLAASAMGSDQPLAIDDKPQVTIGLVTDLHYADKKPAGSRHYRETIPKLEAAAAQFQKDQPTHIVELGDFIDAADAIETEKAFLKHIHKEFSSLPGQKHYVLGNHCVHTLTKKEFLDGVGQEKSYYSFDAGGIHFVVLDACFRGDGQPYGRKNFKWTDPNIPKSQVEWLANDLKEAQKKSIIFVHQRLDVANHYGVKNSAEVRKVLEESGNVLSVFQGHSHKNDVKEINGIHYCVHRAMVEGAGKENSGFSTVRVFPNGTIQVEGFLKQKSYDFA